MQLLGTWKPIPWSFLQTSLELIWRRHEVWRSVVNLQKVGNLQSKWCKDRKIMKGLSRPDNGLFSLLRSGKHFRSLKANKVKRKSFFPQTIWAWTRCRTGLYIVLHTIARALNNNNNCTLIWSHSYHITLFKYLGCAKWILLAYSVFIIVRV